MAGLFDTLASHLIPACFVRYLSQTINLVALNVIAFHALMCIWLVLTKRSLIPLRPKRRHAFHFKAVHRTLLLQSSTIYLTCTRTAEARQPSYHLDTRSPEQC